MLGFNKKKTVAQVMSQFTKALTELQDVINGNKQEAEVQEQIIKDASAYKKQCLDEVSKAEKVASKLEELVM